LSSTIDLRNQRDKPSYAHLLLTRSCNLRCPQCFVDAGVPGKGEMNTVELLKAADDLVRMGIRTVHVEGGEALLQPDAIEVLKRLADNVPDVILVTNATRLDEACAKRLADAGLTQVALSLDGATKETHDAFRPGNFDKVVRAIELLQAEGLGVRISTTLMKPNFHECVLLLEKCLEWGIRILNYDGFDRIGRGIEHPELALDPEDWKTISSELFPRALEVAESMQVKVAIPSKYVKLLGIDRDDPCYEWIYCTSGLSQLSIMPDGNVIPCFILLTTPEYVAGNIKEQSLEEIWNDSPYMEHYRTLPLSKRCPIGYHGHLFFSNVRNNDESVSCGAGH
jgi:MoaA/NifB/PqqE/SkfB family radical SAM enzyme